MTTLVGNKVYLTVQRQKEEIKYLQEEKKYLEKRLQEGNDKVIEQTKEIEQIKKDMEALRVSKAVKSPQRQATQAVSTVKSPNVEQWRPIVAQYPWNTDYALRVMDCESHGDPTNVNWEDAKITGMPSNGLFQINSYQNWNWSDPATNIARAYEMYSRRGWQPWTCARRV